MRKKAMLLGAGVLGVFILLMCMGAMADNPQPVTPTANVAATIQMNFSETTINWGGVLAPPGPYNDETLITINSNRGWQVVVRKNTDLTGPTETIPSTNLRLTTSSLNLLVTQTVTNAEFNIADTLCLGGLRGGNIQSNADYDLTIPWDQTNETYGATHTYTASQI